MSPDPMAHPDQAACRAGPAGGGRGSVPGDSAAPMSADGAADPPARRDGADAEVIVRRTRDGWRVEGAGTGASGRSPRSGADRNSQRSGADQNSQRGRADRNDGDGPLAGSPGRTGGDQGHAANDQGEAAGPSAGDPGQAAGEVMPDLVSAMVLAELLAGDVPRPRKPAVTEVPHPKDGSSASGTTAGSATAGRATAGSATAGRATAGSATAGRATAGSATAGSATAGSATVGRAAEGTKTGARTGGTEPGRREGPGQETGGANGTGSGPAADDGGAARGAENTRLKATVAQLEHALATRVRVEQAIGVLAERHRLTPRQAFDLLRKVARAGGNRVHDLAGEVVASTANPLLLLPEELARPQHQPARSRPRQRLRGGRDGRDG